MITNEEPTRVPPGEPHIKQVFKGKVKVGWYAWKQRNSKKARIYLPVAMRPPEGEYFLMLGPDEQTICQQGGTPGGTPPGAPPNEGVPRQDILFLMRFFQKHKAILQPLVTASERAQLQELNVRLKQK